MENTRKKPEKGKHRLHEEVVLPIDGLPLNIQDYINEVASVYQCPREFPTVAVFSAFSTTIGKRVKITDGKYTSPIMFWVVNVAPSDAVDLAGAPRSVALGQVGLTDGHAFVLQANHVCSMQTWLACPLEP